MSLNVEGNTKGLAPSEHKKVERLFQRRVARNEIVSLDLAREIYSVAHELKRRVGVLLNREGGVEKVFLGTKDLLYLPDLGRYRLGRGRLRRLRLVFSDLSSNEDHAAIPTDIYTDLEKLRLDAVVSVKTIGNHTLLSYAHVWPSDYEKSAGVRTESISDLGLLKIDFQSMMENLENELSSEPNIALITGKTPAVLIGVYDKRDRSAETSIVELEELARTAGVHVLDKVVQRRDLDPRTLLGKGKLEEVVLHCLRLGAEMLIFDTELKPGQWRAITNSTELKIIDRSMLILDIFAQRARSSDGRLQVELAQLKYNLPRLVEKDAGLSRLSGGIGGRGPGETKLEIGRRRIRDRISELEKKIDKLGAQRDLRRQRRKSQYLPLVAIVGYTNAGKSTLFNAMTKGEVLTEDKLFATLDPAKRRLVFPHEPTSTLTHGPVVVMSDTVGFIRNLPEELKNAFRATLEELYDADLTLHVVDASDPDVTQKFLAVEKILEEMSLGGIARINVLNKIDAISRERLDELLAEIPGIGVSAVKKEGFDMLLSEMRRRLERAFEKAGMIYRMPDSASALVEAGEDHV